jgi:hypothetical protein
VRTPTFFLVSYRSTEAQLFGYNPAVWQTIHILGRVQVFVVSMISAVAIAVPLAIMSVPSDGTPLQRFLGPSPQFDPLLNFGWVFLSLLTAFTGYYHLGWRGALRCVAASPVTYYLFYYCALLISGFEVVGHSWMIQTVTFLGAVLAGTVFIFVAHMKASNSPGIRNEQRALRLRPPAQTS